MGKLAKPSLIIIARELHSRESELSLLHVIIDGLVEVLAHVGLKYHREVVPEPFTLTSRIQPQNK
jgi:hypothetical protein